MNTNGQGTNGRPRLASDPRQLALELLVMSARFSRLAAREVPSTIPSGLWRVLAQLDDMGSTRLTDLAAADRVAASTATLMVQRLVDRGWAVRSADSGDRRAVRVTITHAGRRVLWRTRDAAADALLPRLAALDPDTRRALADGIEALARVLAADEPQAAGDQNQAEGRGPARAAPGTASRTGVDATGRAGRY